MATVNEKMTAIADKVRTLSGLEDSMSLDDMSNNLNDTCTEVDTQAVLIAQITAALENKTSGSSDIDVSGVTATPSDVLAGKVFVDSTGTSQTGNIPTKTSSDLTASGATVSVPSGYYASTASKSVSTATQATPSITISSSGLITASATQSAGYVSGGTKSGTKQLTTQGAKTITPSTSSQTAVASGRYTTGTVTVAAIPSNYEDVATETTEYTSLNDELEDVINSLPAAGGSGGSEPATCTLTLSFGDSPTDTSGAVGRILYNIYENGKISTVYEDIMTTGLIVRENIVKGSSLITQYSFQDKTNATYITSLDGHYQACQIDGDAKLHGYTCFVAGTKILLYNGLSKEVENITYDDELLVWDFDNGCYASAKPLWIKKQQSSSYYYHCEFENGITLNLVGSNGKCHRVFSIDEGRFESATDCVGKMVMTELGATKLVSCEKVEETVEYYNIITKYHFNLFANSVLTSCRLNNLYPIEDMKFVKDNQNYIPYEAYSNITKDFYEGLRLSERNSDDISWLNDYVGNLYALMEIKEV